MSEEVNQQVRMFLIADTGCLFQNDTFEHTNFSDNLENFCYPDCTEMYFYNSVNEVSDKGSSGF